MVASELGADLKAAVEDIDTKLDALEQARGRALQGEALRCRWDRLSRGLAVPAAAI